MAYLSIKSENMSSPWASDSSLRRAKLLSVFSLVALAVVLSCASARAAVPAAPIVPQAGETGFGAFFWIGLGVVIIVGAAGGLLLLKRLRRYRTLNANKPVPAQAGARPASSVTGNGPGPVLARPKTAVAATTLRPTTPITTPLRAARRFSITPSSIPKWYSKAPAQWSAVIPTTASNWTSIAC